MELVKNIVLCSVLVVGILTQSGFAQELSGENTQKDFRDDSQRLSVTDAAGSKERLFRNQTMAAELLESAQDKNIFREKLETELFRELKRKLPQMQIGGIKYYFVESDRRLNEDQLLLYSIELEQQYEKWRSLQAKPKPIRDVIVAQNAHKLVSETETEKIIRWLPGSTISYCIMKRSFGFGPQATQRYNSVVSEFKKAIEAWTSIDQTSVPDFVYKSDLDDSPISDTPAGVTFAVWSVDLPDSVIASAFFPNDPEEDWNVLIDPERYFSTDLAFDRVGVLRHELGHVLGFRHEHPRSEAPLVCQTLEVFDDDVIPLGDYDPVSVMHYFCRGFKNSDQEELNKQRRKLQLTEIDKRGVRLVYPSAGNSSGFRFMEFDPSRNSDRLVRNQSLLPMSRRDLLVARSLVFDNNLHVESLEHKRGSATVATQHKKNAAQLESLKKKSIESQQFLSPDRKVSSDAYAEKLRSIRPRTRQFKFEKSSDALSIPLAMLSEPRQKLERIIDKADFLPANFMVAGANSQRYVGRIAFKASFQHPQGGAFYPGDGWGTGFLVSSSLLLTNNHVLENQAFSRDKVRVEFNYQRRLIDGQLEDKDSYDLDPEDFFFTDQSLDFTLVRVKPKQSMNMGPANSMVLPGHRWSFYQLGDSSIVSLFKNMQVNIIQHPAGRPKEIVIHNNIVEETFDNHIRYSTDTQEGSSGSPVFDNSWVIVALHHAAGEKKSDGTWKNNQGVRIDRIIAKMKSSLPLTVLEELGID